MIGISLGIPGSRIASSSLPAFDFSSISAGASSLPDGLTLTRASSNDSVQTGTSSIVTSIAANAARIGRRVDSDPVALVIEESRSNLVSTARAMTGTGWTAGAGTATAGQSSPDGTSNATRQQTTSAQFCAYFTRAVADGAVLISAWAKATSAPFTSTTQFGSANTNFSLTTAWQRVSATFTAAGTYFITAQNAGGAVSQDASWDLFQIEAGAFATEWIPQGSTRSADRLVLSKKHDSGGRVGIEVVFQPKGARSSYSADPFVIRGSGTDYVQINCTTGVVTCASGGTTYATPIGIDWSANDTVKLYVELGGSASPLVVYQINSDTPVLLSLNTPTAVGAWTATTCDLLGNSGGNVLSCWVRSVRFYSAEPEWVA